jgi:hypothetical protein
MMLGATRMLLRYKGPGRTTKVTCKVDPLPTMMEEGKVGQWRWGKETIPGSGLVWYEVPKSATRSVGVGGCEDMGYEERARGGSPHSHRDGCWG